MHAVVEPSLHIGLYIYRYFQMHAESRPFCCIFADCRLFAKYTRDLCVTHNSDMTSHELSRMHCMDGKQGVNGVYTRTECEN